MLLFKRHLEEKKKKSKLMICDSRLRSFPCGFSCEVLLACLFVVVFDYSDLSLDLSPLCGHLEFVRDYGFVLSPNSPNAPSKTPSTKDTSSSSIDYIPKSPTFSTSPSTNGYLNSPTSPPPRVPLPPPIQKSRSIDITLTLSPITPLDVQFNTPSPSPPLFGHPIPWNLLEADGDSCLCCIHNRTLIFGLRDELQYIFPHKPLGLGYPKPVRILIEMADKSMQSPKGMIVILDIFEDDKDLIILGRPMLAIAHARIGVFGKKILLEVEGEKVMFNGDNIK
ncbi:hypothetical protein Tco_1312676 [Tanacetum coccineum]